MKKQPLTSVVIPAYNAELFLERTLRSALGQTHSNLEVIVVDDGSTDKTRVIAEAAAAADDRVRILSVPNGGVAKARNIGIAEANGEFVAFLFGWSLFSVVGSGAIAALSFVFAQSVNTLVKLPERPGW